MPSESEVYAQRAVEYEALIAREDYQSNIPRALDELMEFGGKDVIDLGAGTGRLAVMLLPRARSVRAFDTSWNMLMVTRDKFRLARRNGLAAVADHRLIPAASSSADVILSGWSVSYLAVWNPASWRVELEKWLEEAKRVLRRDGQIVLLESLGTGNEMPMRLAHLENFYPWLDEKGFESKWIRTDYWFESLDEAVYLAGFFFGEEMADLVKKERLVILPECTGVWWLKV